MALKQPRSAPFIPPGSPVIDENDPLSGMTPPGGAMQSTGRYSSSSQAKKKRIQVDQGAWCNYR